MSPPPTTTARFVVGVYLSQASRSWSVTKRTRPARSSVTPGALSRLPREPVASSSRSYGSVRPSPSVS
jgi:hypothetical protein